MDTDSCLNLMSQYDFNKPINATVIYEDDDAEYYPRTTIRPTIQDESVVQSNNFNFPTACLSKSYEQQPSLPIIDRDAPTPILMNNESVVQSNNFNFPMACLSKSYEQQPSLPIIDRDAPTPILMNNEICNIRESNQPPYIINIHNQDKIAQVIVNNVGNLSDKILHHYPAQNLHIPTSSNENETFRSKETNSTTSNKDKIVENRLSSYISNLFNAVSENVLAILEAYRYYKRIMDNRESTNVVIQNSHNYFLSIKIHYFKLSYSTLTILFLPEHKTSNFEERFLANTLRIAQSKRFYCTYHELQGIYSEMMHWLVLNKEQLIERSHHNVCGSNNPQEQRKPASSQKKSRYIQKRRAPAPYKDPKTQNIFLSGPPGREVQISVNQNFLQSRPNGSITGASTNLTHSNQNTYAASQSGIASTISNCIVPTHNNESNNSISIQNSNYLQNCRNTTISGIPSWTPTHCTNQTVPENYDIQITNVRSERTTETCPLEHRRKSTTDQAMRSSESRDSGFISPLNFNSTTEQTCNMNAEKSNNYLEQQVTASSPEITSLKPNTSICRTCGRDTNTKCRRCYQAYYCSLLCQTLDWQDHIKICKSNETNTTNTFVV